MNKKNKPTNNIFEVRKPPKKLGALNSIPVSDEGGLIVVVDVGIVMLDGVVVVVVYGLVL